MEFSSRHNIVDTNGYFLCQSEYNSTSIKKMLTTSMSEAQASSIPVYLEK